MLTYSYKAKHGPDKIIDGVIQAEDRSSAIHKIIQSGFMPIDIIQAQEKDLSRKITSLQLKKILLHDFGVQKISLSDVVEFTQEMADLIDAAVPLLKSLQIISRQTKKLVLKKIIEDMYEFVKDGGSFAGALAQHSGVFSSLYINMVKAGEMSGQLEKVLSRLADYLTKEQEMRSKVKASLAYPMLILAVGVVTMFVLLTFVIPRLTVMFDDLDQALPLPTIILTSMSSFCAHFWWLMIGVFVAIGFYIRQILHSDKGRFWMDQFKLKMPILGNFIKIFEIGRFARTLGTLIESGVTINKALDSVWMIMDNVILREEIQNVSQEVTHGSSLKAALKQCQFFPESAINVISVGEETGRLDRSLYKIADNYERQSDQMVKTMLSLLGPIFLVVIVSVVGFVVIALLLPIFQMNLLIQ